MEDELDRILLDQLHACKRSLKTIKNLRKFLPNDETGLDQLEEFTLNRMVFFERYIKDKSLLEKKIKKKKPISKPSIYDIYRNYYIISMVTYKVMINSMHSYLSFFRKNDK